MTTLLPSATMGTSSPGGGDGWMPSGAASDALRVASMRPLTISTGRSVVDWQRMKAALIRAFWAFVFPMVGVLVLYFADPEVLKEAGIDNALYVSVISGVLYGLKKLVWPDTTY